MNRHMYAFLQLPRPLVGANLKSSSLPLTPVVQRGAVCTRSGQPRRVSGVARAVWRPDREDVERISRGQAAKHRGTGSRAVPHRLNEEERRSYDQAVVRGYVSLGSNAGHRRERKGSPLFNTWRMWCDAHAVPAVMFVRRGLRRPMDEVWVDVSTLRGQGPLSGDLLQAVQACTGELGAVEGGIDGGDNELVDELKESVQSGECVPTWRIPEDWIKFQFEDRSRAKEVAQVVSNLFVTDDAGVEGKSKAKSKAKAKKTERKERRRRESDE